MTSDEIKAMPTKALWDRLRVRTLGHPVYFRWIIEELERRMACPSVFLLIAGSGDDGDEKRVEEVHATRESAEKWIGTYPKREQSHYSIDERAVLP